MPNVIDLRSDTVTQPTEAMRRAMQEAPLGDDVYGDDPTVNRLEALAAAMVGKEAAMFVPTGTMGNQVAVMTHTHAGDEIIAGAQSHIIKNEGGAAARLSGVAAALVDNADGIITPADVERQIRPSGNVHFPPTTLLCLENALGNGSVVPLDVFRATCDTAHAHGVPVHLDGARIFNAALALDVDAKSIAACVDSVMFCVSKGLCAPVGSLLCGRADFIDRARYARKLMGGGMRQAGVLAACGIVALETMVARLADDHANARHLAGLLDAINGVHVDSDHLDINMVFWHADAPGFDADALTAHLTANGVLPGRVYGGPGFRFVTNHGVSRADVETAANLVRDYVSAL